MWIGATSMMTAYNTVPTFGDARDSEDEEEEQEYEEE